MNKKLTACVLIVFLSCVCMPVLAKFSSEYKLIKRAVEKGETSPKAGQLQWLKMEVQDKKNKTHTVKLSIPIALVNIVVGSAKAEQVNICQGADIDFRKAWDMLSKGGPTSLLEVNCEESFVKIWLE